MASISQTQIVFEALQKGPLTSMMAYTDLGCVHLPRRIKDLKELGVEIETEITTGVNRRGDTVHFNIYRLAGGVTPTSFASPKSKKLSPFARGMMFAAKAIIKADPSFKGTVGALALKNEIRRASK